MVRQLQVVVHRQSDYYILIRGGMKESGMGRENGVEAYESCQYSSSSTSERPELVTLLEDTQSKSVIVNIASNEESRATGDWFAEEGNSKRYG